MTTLCPPPVRRLPLLPYTKRQQPHVPFHGHAIEARVYAEDPFRKFLPSIGPLVTYKEPASTARSSPLAAADAAGGREAKRGVGVRVDSGVVEGSEVSMFYDPMISKLVTYGDTREGALERMGTALDGKGCFGYLIRRASISLTINVRVLYGLLPGVVIISSSSSS